MPLIIPKTLPAYDALYEENVFVMHRERALSQHIRPLEILILNLMPTKIATETQIARLLANTPIQVHMTLLQTASHAATHVSAAFPYIYILYLFSGAYSLPARRWDRAAEICAFFSPTMSYLNMGKMDSSASTPGRAV